MKKMQGNGFIAKVMNSFFPPIFILLALIIGGVALSLTPKEEDPQIVVPMADVFITAPGLSAKQVEKQVTEPLEKLLSQIDGVEYVYSTSMEGGAQVVVRFLVGEGRESALVKLYNKLYSNQDKIPHLVSHWAVKPIEIDDVPIVIAALYSTQADQIGSYELRRIAEQATQRLNALPDTNAVAVIGGQPRVIEINLNSAKMASRQTSIDDIQRALNVTDQKLSAGEIHQQGKRYLIESGQFYQQAESLQNLVVNVIDGNLVYLQDIAEINDGYSEPINDTWIQYSPSSQESSPAQLTAAKSALSSSHVYPAVYISVAKQQGANAVSVADAILKELVELKRTQLPESVKFDIIRNYGQTADLKVTNLLSSLGFSILTVVVFIGLFLNWRSALVVGIAIPISYGAALGLDLAFGYSINRVTLFALILALGLIVDDPIASIDNIERFLKQKGLDRGQAIVFAMLEIRSALLMSTVAIVIVFTPMFFITGMMGPYMAPLAFNVPISVIFSTLVAFLITPWLAKKILSKAQDNGHYSIEGSALYKVYRLLLLPLLNSKKASWIFLSLVVLMFLGAAILPALRIVPLKLLPFDNKNEFQLIVNMPESESFVDTSNALKAFSHYLVTQPEVVSVSAFAGTASPIDFNGMVRHYFLRQQGNVGELRIVLVDKDQRHYQSHQLVTRMRTDLELIAQKFNADIQLVEVPPGPPVIATITAEVYGYDGMPYEHLQEQALILADRIKQEEFVSEVDTSIQGELSSWQFIIDRDKAALSGISVDDINRTLAAANQGAVLGYLHKSNEVNALPMVLRLAKDQRDQLDPLLALTVKGQAGISKINIQGALIDAPQPVLQLSELGHFVKRNVDQPIYHKNLKPLVYVYAEPIGRAPVEVVADISADQNSESSMPVALSDRHYFNNGSGKAWSVDPRVEIVWSGEGEWKLTLDVFRDLGIAFAVALLGVFIVMLIQTGLPLVSGIIMLAIPLSVIGIMPGFWLLNSLGGRINGYPDPSLFTATAMIGMIALAGIVVRNSLVLVEFIQQSLKEGKELKAALVEAGAVRMRPILLTAGTTLLGNIVITLDPIFNGLAWAIIFGITASTIFTLLVIPVVYYLAYKNTESHEVVIDNMAITLQAEK